MVDDFVCFVSFVGLMFRGGWVVLFPFGCLIVYSACRGFDAVDVGHYMVL